MAPSADVCDCCSDNFIVNSKSIACYNCNNVFHLMCVSLKDAWAKIMNESPNIMWFCNKCQGVVECKIKMDSSANKNDTDKAILSKEVECLKRELQVTSRLVTELGYSNQLQKDVIHFLEEKVKSSDNNLGTLGRGQVPSSHNKIVPEHSQFVQTSTSETTKRSNKQPVNNQKPNGFADVCNSGKTNNNAASKQNTNNTKIDVKTVSAAILQAQTENKMKEINDLKDTSGEEYKNVTYKKKTRRYVVGRNSQDGTEVKVQTIPRTVTLHVTRLAPRTKPEDLKSGLINIFPEVICEPHQSKHPDVYTSMKVTISQENYSKAWRRDTWPNGALVSRFFVKREVSPK